MQRAPNGLLGHNPTVPLKGLDVCSDLCTQHRLIDSCITSGGEPTFRLIDGEERYPAVIFWF